MSLALRIRIQPTMGQKVRQSTLGVCVCCRVIHQCEAARKNTELSRAYQSRYLQGRERN